MNIAAVGHGSPINHSNPSQVIAFGCRTNILGDGGVNYSVYLKAWATHTSGELQVYMDESMAQILARFPLGHLENSIIINENVLCLKTSNDTCTFMCDSKQQQMNWLKVIRFPLLSPLPINQSKGWRWEDLNSVKDEDDTNSENLNDTSLILDAKAHADLQEIQERNRSKLKEKEERDKKIAKLKEFRQKQALKNRKDRLIKQGREEEINWTKTTKNMYKTLGIGNPSSLSFTPSLYKQKITSTETPRERTAKMSRDAAETHRAAKEKMLALAIQQTKSVAKARQEYRQKHRSGQCVTNGVEGEESLYEGSSLDELSQLSTQLPSQVWSMVENSPAIKYKTALIYTQCREEHNKACVQIQKVWRGFMCRNVHNTLSKYYAAVLIQKAWLLAKFKRIMKKNLRQLVANKREMDRYYREQEQTKRLNDQAEARAWKKARDRAKFVSCVRIQTAMKASLARRRRGVPTPIDLNSSTEEHFVLDKKKSLSPAAPNIHEVSNNEQNDIDDHHSVSSVNEIQKQKKKKRRHKVKTCSSSSIHSDTSEGTPPLRTTGKQAKSTDKHMKDNELPLLTSSAASPPPSRTSSLATVDNNLKQVHDEPVHTAPAPTPETSTVPSRKKSTDLTPRSGDSEPEPEERHGLLFDFDGRDDNNDDERDTHQESVPIGKSSAIPKFQEAVRKVITQQNIILDIFGIDDQDEEYSSEIIVIEPEPPTSIRSSYKSPKARGKSFRKLLSL